MQVLYMPVCREVARLCLVSLITLKRQNLYWENMTNARPFLPLPFFVNIPVVQLFCIVSIYNNYVINRKYLGDRSIVGHMVLVHGIGVRLPVPQHI